MEREHERRYRQLVELAPDAIMIHDGERIVLANAAAVRLAGGTHRGELVGRPIEAFLDPPYLKAAQHRLVAPEDPVGEAAPPIRDTLRRLDGTTVEVEVRTIAFMEDGHPSVHLVIRDVSERLAAEHQLRQVEQRLNQTQRMEAVAALAGGVAHEINNMMSVVLGFSNFLLEDPDLPASMRSDAAHIVRAAQRAATVTGQLLSFSRRGLHTPQVVDLGAAVREAEPLIRRLLGESRHLALAAEGSPRVRIDPRQLDQVIVNLALNARDAMPADGTLTMTTAEIDLEGELPTGGRATIPAGRYGLLVVRDTGTGMDVAIQARIFEPFFTTKPVGEGTGLGLAASYGIIKQNDGYIAVASSPGEGAAFSLYFPIVAQAPAGERRGSPRTAPREPERPGATVLLVEDEPGVREVAARILRLGGLRILEASNGTDALEVVNRHGPPDIVLSDVVMPKMGGPELARRLKARWPALPVLFMSGYSTAELRQRGSIGTEIVTISKPFASSELVRSVMQALAQERPGAGAAPRS